MLEMVNKNPPKVKQLQQTVKTTVDGIAGPNTLKKAERHFGCAMIAHLGELVPLHGFTGKVVHSLSLHELHDGSKNWSYRSKPIKGVCVHWGGLNTRHCFNVFFNPNGKHVSSHFLIGRNPKTKELEVLQCLDTQVKSWHGGKVNNTTIGIDICQSPVPKHFKKTKELHPDVELTTNHTSRGPSEVVSLDPELAEFANSFITALVKATGLDHKPALISDDVLPISQLEDYSVFGHHNVSKNKWDVAIWMDKLYGSLNGNLRDYC